MRPVADRPHGGMSPLLAPARSFAGVRLRRLFRVSRTARLICAIGGSLFVGDVLAQATLNFCFNAWPPYTYVEDGKAQGVSVEIAREAATRAGFAATFVELPWIRCLEAVRKDDRVDAVLDAARRPDFIQGSTSTSVYTNTFWVREEAQQQRFDPSTLRDES
ncbi:MAG: hypothetical protein DWQ08_08660, partial [Proteobacteria bacterium]